MTKSRHPQIGGTFDDWLKDEGIHEEATTVAIKRVLAWQLEQAMKDGKITKTAMARRMETSRPQLDRLLDPDNPNVHLTTIARAARAVGKRLRIEMVDAV